MQSDFEVPPPNAESAYIEEPNEDLKGKYPHLPDVLLKSVEDPYIYAMGIKTGLVIIYNSAEIDGEWVHISFEKGYNCEEKFGNVFNTQTGYIPKSAFFFPRGISIRISDIVWIADSPFEMNP